MPHRICVHLRHRPQRALRLSLGLRGEQLYHEQWVAVQALNLPQQRKPWAATSTYLLSGLVVCGYCGSACSGSADNRSTLSLRKRCCGS